MSFSVFLFTLIGKFFVFDLLYLALALSCALLVFSFNAITSISLYHK
nr:MAG TPA: hypothetical protein [Caudoviricetes sp.]